MVLVGLFFSSFAYGEQKYSLGFTMRNEYGGTTTATKVGSGDEVKSNEARFGIKRARLDFKGKLSDKANVRIRHRFDKSSDKMGNGKSGNLDFAYMDYKFHDMFTLRIGREYNFHGAAHGAFYSRDNYYSRPQGWFHFLNTDGLSGHMNFSGNKVSLYWFNSKETMSGTQTSPKAQGFGLLYRGDFGMFKPVFSVFNNPKGPRTETTETIAGPLTRTTTAGKTKYTGTTTTTETSYEGGVADMAISLGGQVNVAGAEIGLTIMDITTAGQKVGGTQMKDTKLSTVGLEVVYKVNEFRPVLMFSSSNQKQDGNDESEMKWTKFALVLEWHPSGGGPAWYAGYSQDASESGKASVTKVTQSRAYLGAFLDASKAF